MYRTRHRPPHVYLDQNQKIYFLTARTIGKKHYFNTDKKKQIFCLCLNAGVQNLNLKLYGWVVLPNHYHLLVDFTKGKDLSGFMNLLNGRSSFELNKLENKRGRKIWYQYLDRCIRRPKDFYTRLNYIHHNPVKHDQVKKMGDYRFSSYNHYLKKYGLGWLNDCFYRYPIIDFTPEEGD